MKQHALTIGVGIVMLVAGYFFSTLTSTIEEGEDAAVRKIVKEEISAIADDVDTLKQGQARMDGKLDGIFQALRNYAESE